MTDRKFIDECQEWLEPHGYTIHSYSGDHSLVVFNNITNIGDDLYIPNPFITCKITQHGEKLARIETHPMKMFIVLKTGWFSFKHPNLENYLNWIKRYYEACLEEEL